VNSEEDMIEKFRGVDIDPKARIKYNDATMSNTLLSTQELKEYDHCCGIHGAMRERRGAKKATSNARRRHSKKLIEKGLQDYYFPE
jgi:hypothetical protein